MKLTAFHAADGDCCLIESRDSPPRRLLVDGGRTASYEANTRDTLGAIRDDGGKLDVICVSHIDDDHISGIVRLIEDEVAWRQFEFLKATKPSTKPPSIARPPKIGEVWHNGLFRLVATRRAMPSSRCWALWQRFWPDRQSTSIARSRRNSTTSSPVKCLRWS